MAVRGWRGELTFRRLRGQEINPGQESPTQRHKRNLIVVDIDGTLFDVRKRWRMAASQARPPSPKFWNLFMSPESLKYDTANNGAAEVLTEIQKFGFEIIYLAGRRMNLLEYTREQLKNNDFPDGMIIHRDKGRPTESFKVSVLNRLKYEGNVIVYIGDDALDDYVGQTAKVPTVRVNSNSGWSNSNVESIISRIEKYINN